MSQAAAREVITISIVASPESHIITINSDSNDPTIPYGFGRHIPIIPQLKWLISTTQSLQHCCKESGSTAYSASMQRKGQPPISDAVRAVIIFDAPMNITMGNMFGRGHLLLKRWAPKNLPTFEPFPSATTHKTETKAHHRDVFPKRGRVSQHVCRTCGQVLRRKRTSSGRPWTIWNYMNNGLIFSNRIVMMIFDNAFTCSWYVSYTYHSPVNMHVVSTYWKRTTPVYWFRLGRNRYGTNGSSPNLDCQFILLKSAIIIFNLCTS